MPKKAIFRKILIVKPSSLGDVVHSLPFLNAIHACFPRAEVHWVIAKGLESLLEGHPMISKLIVINKDLWKKLPRAGKTIGEISQLRRRLRDEQYDLVVDLQGLLRSGLITRATRAPLRIGFEEAREGSRLFYTIKVRGGRDLHAVDRYMKVASAVCCHTSDIVFPFPPTGAISTTIREMKNALGEYAVIVPGARWKTKIWPAENFGMVAGKLPIRSVVIGSSSDREIAKQVVSASHGKARSMAGRTDLRELIQIMRGAKVVITNDSGPMHIAAALHIPVIALFGPTSPLLTGPYGTLSVVLQSHQPCVPCFKRSCKDILCMKEITPVAVLEQVNKVLSISLP